MYDQAQSARLGQKVGLENPGIRLVETTAEVTAPYQGQMVYAVTEGSLKVYSGTTWQDITSSPGGGGDTVILHFPTPSTAWIGVHGFGQAAVDVTLSDSLGNKIMADIGYTDANTAQASFAVAVAGYMLIQK